MSCRKMEIHFTSIIGLNYPVCMYVDRTRKLVHVSDVNLPISINTYIHRIRSTQVVSWYDFRRRISLGPRWNRNGTFSCEHIVNLSTWHDHHTNGDNANIYDRCIQGYLFSYLNTSSLYRVTFFACARPIIITKEEEYVQCV